MTTCCVVVIGHVDHGKTALVRALTGIETDHLPEEKTRGLSIVPGFAHRSYPVGTVDFIDAPGHEDFVQAMIAGASGAAAVLLVINAAAGVGAQTLEHLRIAKLLGIRRGIIAVTKSDLVASADRAARLAEIRAELSGTMVADIEPIYCSAEKGEGIERLHGALSALVEDAPELSGPCGSYLAVDRSFTLAGRGTIVTGTLLGKALSADDTLTAQPGDMPVSLRGLQSRGGACDTVAPGERVAANLRNVSAKAVPRGTVLCGAEVGGSGRVFDISLTLLPSAAQPLKHMQDVRVLFGTSGAVAQLRLFGTGRVEPGQSALAQLRFASQMMGYAGQRAILRRLSPPETISGAVFLDPQATPSRSGDTARVAVLQAAQSGDLRRIAATLARTLGGVADLADIARLARTTAGATRAALAQSHDIIEGDWTAARTDIAACGAAMLRSLDAYHMQHPLRPLAPRKVIALPDTSPRLLRHVENLLVRSRKIITRDASIALQSHDPAAHLGPDQHARISAIEAAMLSGGLSPPPSDSLIKAEEDADLLDLLLHCGTLIALHNVALDRTLVLHQDTLKAAAATLRAQFKAQHFTTGAARDALSTSRRVIVPLLEHFDSVGLTLRQGDTRAMCPINSVSPPAAAQ